MMFCLLFRFQWETREDFPFFCDAFRSVVGKLKMPGTSWLSEDLEIDPIMDEPIDTNVVKSMFPVGKKPKRAR